MMIRLLHYTRDPLARVRSVEQPEPDTFSAYGKPRGLWVSIEGEDDWKDWCENEHYQEGPFHTYEIVLREDARILRTDPFAIPHTFRSIYNRVGVNWKAIADEYQGVVIAPYWWEARLEVDWYYPWDCASGCIWDADAIAEIIDVGITTFTPRDYDYAD